MKGIRKLTMSDTFLPILFGAGEKHYEVSTAPLPLDTRIVGCQMGDRICILILESDQFEPVKEGAEIPDLALMIKSIYA